MQYLIKKIKSYIYGTHNNYSNILGVKTENYIKREIYSVREGIQYDGLDYYVYEFSKENGHDLVKKVDNKALLDEDYNTDIQKLKNEIKLINIILSYGGRIINEI